MDAYKEITEAISRVDNSKINGKEFLEIIKPFRDVECVTRCKDCWKRNSREECPLRAEGVLTPDDWFCKDGESDDERYR